MTAPHYSTVLAQGRENLPDVAAAIGYHTKMGGEYLTSIQPRGYVDRMLAAAPLLPERQRSLYETGKIMGKESGRIWDQNVLDELLKYQQ